MLAEVANSGYCLLTLPDHLTTVIISQRLFERSLERLFFLIEGKVPYSNGLIVNMLDILIECFVHALSHQSRL